MSWLPVLWFLVVLALIPLALWVLKRMPLQPLQAGSRVVGSTYLGPGQRLLTVEVGEGEDRRWLVLGATAHHIQLIKELPPQAAAPAAPPVPPFAKFLQRAKGTST